MELTRLGAALDWHQQLPQQWQQSGRCSTFERVSAGWLRVRVPAALLEVLEPMCPGVAALRAWAAPSAWAAPCVAALPAAPGVNPKSFM
ncbi:hypothetical protein D4764_17G0000830 [Takifugu flavidus]|uniref:Uncharacterized protein n=1 Tax=Takifugu flavidus TaxID=433684 RepID=A0A5C6NXB3_9TELE|nr:hypothetical protein D4764_17G0000830 [Takifugu flavidus]